MFSCCSKSPGDDNVGMDSSIKLQQSGYVNEEINLEDGIQISWYSRLFFKIWTKSEFAISVKQFQKLRKGHFNSFSLPIRIISGISHRIRSFNSANDSTFRSFFQLK